MIGTSEIVVIALVAGILLFGASKVIDWARALGEAEHVYKKAKREGNEE